MLLIPKGLWVETSFGHAGHVLFKSSGPHPVYKISRFDPDSALNLVC